MVSATTKSRSRKGALPKSPTGIQGLDEITGGGLPKGRPTLICGAAGCGKTLFAMEFLVNGATRYGEHGVFVSFEESAEDLVQNMAAMGYDLAAMEREGRLAIDHVHIERSEIEETGEYDLEGLFVRLDHAIKSVGAKRVALDTLEALFAGLQNESILRSEIRRLFRWLKARGVTAVVTGEVGRGQLTRQGLEEYASDCVILLDHRVHDQVSTRRLRVVKYRGSAHGTNEYPFLIDDQHGITVMPLSSLGLEHPAPTERVSSGIPRLDTMLDGGGFYRGSSVLVSGAAGSGKTSAAAQFAEAACRRGERCLYFAFEESPEQIMRNMRSIGIDLAPWAKQGLLRFHAARPTLQGLERHLVSMHECVTEFDPRVVVVDPITNLITTGTRTEVKSMLMRLLDYLKRRQTTTFLTSLTVGAEHEETDTAISSLIDTWILLRTVETSGERNRMLYLIKSRGMAHSNQVREFLMTPQGIELVDVYVGPDGPLTGSARISREAGRRSRERRRQVGIEARRRLLDRRRRAVEARIEELRTGLQGQEEEFRALLEREDVRVSERRARAEEMGRARRADRSEEKPKPARRGASKGKGRGR